jgi:hypothetical protein
MTRNGNESEGLVDLAPLVKEAAGSEYHEAFMKLESANDHRIGLTVLITVDGEVEYTMEILLCVLRSNADVDVSLLERAEVLGERLGKRGYTLFHQDDGWMLCEKNIHAEEVDDECRFVKELLNEFEGYKNN